MTEKTLKYYAHKLTHLRRDNKYGGAPHKPLMILSLISNIEVSLIKSNKVFITPELVGVFKKLWSDLVESERHHCIFAMPFYHLRTEAFWRLKANKGFENVVKSKIAMKSFSNLNSAIDYAEIDEELFVLLNDKVNREILKKMILEKYFPNSVNSFPSDNGTDFLNNIENQILNEPSETYKSKIIKLKKELKSESFEEEKYLRGNVFKRQIPVIYNNTCAISGLKIDAIFNVSLIDSCHIVPFSESYDDTITNGISLTPTLHRAFDRGLISIDSNYCVLISDKFIEKNSDSNYSISQFKGKEILLPENVNYYPALSNFKFHRDKIFK
ncbi:hypothetical protein BFP78_08085 [Gaetbulibacter sp. 5U11]|nr:hypothetical protein BFP78_08085 [Gaetbulibacter sp. 5U11]